VGQHFKTRAGVADWTCWRRESSTRRSFFSFPDLERQVLGDAGSLRDRVPALRSLKLDAGSREVDGLFVNRWGNVGKRDGSVVKP
jgi:hypothetical protein